jgi:hypothetical protein
VTEPDPNAATPAEPAAPEEPAAPAEPAPTAAPATSGGSNSGPVGQERGVGFAIVMWIVTLGIYGLYWLYKSFAEVKAHRGEGVGGVVGILLCLVIVGYFKLPQYVGRMYSAEGNQRPPVSGISGLWVFVPYVGTFIWIAKNQGALNEYWRAKGSGSVAAVPASSTF